jgi:Secretion system C-terminal sorting domain
LGTSIIDTFDITLSTGTPIAIANITPANMYYCGGAMVLNSNTNTSGIWQKLVSGNLINNTPNHIGDTTIINSVGTYIFTAYNQCSLVRDTLNIVSSKDSFATYKNICDDPFPHIWNGNSYWQSGTYNSNYTNMKGCDSIQTLVLDISSQVSILYDTFCKVAPFSSPYTWQGNQYYGSGTYSIVFNKPGCDSFSVLKLFWVNTLIFKDTTVCENNLPFVLGTFSFTSVNQSGSGYNVYSFGPTSCGTNTWYNVFIPSANGITLKDTICSNQLPYYWLNNGFYQSGVYLDTFISSIGCDSFASLQLVVLDTNSSILKDTICSNQVPYYWLGNSYNQSGNYKDTFMNTAGCDSVATLNLVVKNTNSTILKDTIISNQLPYSWLGNNYYQGGVFEDTFLNVQGCDSFSQLQLFVFTINTHISNEYLPSNGLQEIKIYPNPSKDKLTLEAPWLVNDKIELYDVLGQKIATYTITHSGNKFEISVLHLIENVYFLRSKYGVVNFLKE